MLATQPSPWEADQRFMHAQYSSVKRNGMTIYILSEHQFAKTCAVELDAVEADRVPIHYHTSLCSYLQAHRTTLMTSRVTVRLR